MNLRLASCITTNNSTDGMNYFAALTPASWGEFELRLCVNPPQFWNNKIYLTNKSQLGNILPY